MVGSTAESRRQGVDAPTPKSAFGTSASSLGPFEAAPWSFERVIDWVADLGYDGVEIDGFWPHSHHEGHASVEGGVPEPARKLTSRLFHLHPIDSDGSLHGVEAIAHFPFGHDSNDFGAVIDAKQPVVSSLSWWTVDRCFSPTTREDEVDALPFVGALADDHRPSGDRSAAVR